MCASAGRTSITQREMRRVGLAVPRPADCGFWGLAGIGGTDAQICCSARSRLQLDTARQRISKMPFPGDGWGRLLGPAGPPATARPSLGGRALSWQELGLHGWCGVDACQPWPPGAEVGGTMGDAGRAENDAARPARDGARPSQIGVAHARRVPARNRSTGCARQPDHRCPATGPG